MRTTKGYADILQMQRPVMTTGEVAGRLGLPRCSASKMPIRLSHDGLALKLRRGLWGIGQRFDPLTIVPALTAPYPSYVSLWSALYYHGMIDQIPRDVYVVSGDRSKRIKTPVATYVVQHDATVWRWIERIASRRLRTLVGGRMKKVLALAERE